ncbi:hypothetical protein Ciccas_008928 [Cichlidogyrus casuarinus]|uniref:Bestrophin homolog n=1 Tax=Cichlidogyrus casuarinus TaxID=1844966 RepID=A0ABD2Q057_9PLAT
MTISYSPSVATARYGIFLRLLFKWRGSIYQLIWKPICVYLFVYSIISILYRTLPRNSNTDVYFQSFERFCIFTRKTITRYLILSSALCFQNISKAAKLCWPSLDSLVKTGLMTQDELESYEQCLVKYPHFNIPLVWAVQLLKRVKNDGLIYTDRCLTVLTKGIYKYWNSNYYMYNSDWISLPLVYHQVVSIAVYAYLFISIFSSQFISKSAVKMYGNDTHNSLHLDHICDDLNCTSLDYNFKRNVASAVDIYFPVFTILELVFYLGWFKVAESLFNPFGLDDDDFDIINLMGRNLATGNLFVDDMFCCGEDNLPDIFLALRKSDEKNMPSSTDISQHDGDREDGLVAALLTENLVPTELPCDADLRSSESKYFFTGGAARLESEAIEDFKNVPDDASSPVCDDEEGKFTGGDSINIIVSLISSLLMLCRLRGSDMP